jgi:hypothetical protein
MLLRPCEWRAIPAIQAPRCVSSGGGSRGKNLAEIDIQPCHMPALRS